MSKTWLVTGGAGFIGSNFVRLALDENWCERVVVFDALTYAGSPENLRPYLDSDPRLVFVHADICEPETMGAALADNGVSHVVHFAAESHVDRSINDPAPFIRTNVLGTQVVLDAARKGGIERVVHVSTDEVYGALPLNSTERFSESSPYAPNSPYAASKAGADMLARAAFHTHAQNVVITNCSNNYGPYQYPEKLIPLIIHNAMAGKKLPVYGDGLYVRDWIHVEDHCRGVHAVLENGAAGETYCIGADNERANIDVVRTVLELTGRDESLIEYVRDRPGHDRRYAIDSSRMHRELGWRPRVSWIDGMAQTVEWYRANDEWLEKIRTHGFEEYYEKNYRK